MYLNSKHYSYRKTMKLSSSYITCINSFLWDFSCVLKINIEKHLVILWKVWKVVMLFVRSKQIFCTFWICIQMLWIARLLDRTMFIQLLFAVQEQPRSKITTSSQEHKDIFLKMINFLQHTCNIFTLFHNADPNDVKELNTVLKIVLKCLKLLQEGMFANKPVLNSGWWKTSIETHREFGLPMW